MINVGQKLRAAILEKDRVKIKELLKNGADPNAAIPGEDFAAIHLGAGTTKSITQLLLKHGANPNVQTIEGTTPLHIAASWGKRDILKVLLKYGADETIRDSENIAAIEVAQNYEFWDCLSILQKRSKQRLRNQLETEKSKSGLCQSIDCPGQVQVNVHREYIDVFTELNGKRSHSCDIDNCNELDANRSLPLMSAIFSLPRRIGNFYNEESDSVTSRETSILSSSVKRKMYLTASSIEHNWENPDTENFFSADPSFNTEVDEESVQVENITQTVETGSLKMNHQNGFLIENKCQVKNNEHPIKKSKSRLYSDSSNETRKVDNIKNNSVCIDECSSVETEDPSKYHLKYFIGPESVCKCMGKNDHTGSDVSSVNIDTSSTIISDVPNGVYSQRHSALDTDHLKFDKHAGCILESKNQNEFLHQEDKVKHRQQHITENVEINKKHDFHSAKKTENKCQETPDTYCFYNKHLQIKIDLRFGPLKSETKNLRDFNCSKSSITERSQNSTCHRDVCIHCYDKLEENTPRVTSMKSTVQPNINRETINNDIYTHTIDILDDSAVKVDARSRHDLHCRRLDKNATKQNGKGKNKLEI